MEIRNRPLLTDTYDRLEKFVPLQDSAYVFGTSPEVRSAHSPEWEAQATNVIFTRISMQTQTDFLAECGDKSARVALRSARQLRELWKSVGHKRVYLDITGLEHQVWAPLVRSALALGLQLLVVYVEPGEYRFSPTPREGDIFDLSERITGIAPLPGFASLTEIGNEEVCFVALLGFEGVRFKYVLEQVQPPPNRIIPVIGVPGFRPEYPFFTYDGNRPVLSETGAWNNVRFAKANCPFSLFYTLDDIASTYPWAILKISMIGTKPHALGAVLFSVTSSRSVELVYDHPIRKAARTEGAARTLVYHVSALSLSTAAA